MADESGFDEMLAVLDGLAGPTRRKLERKALQAVGSVVLPVLVAATPLEAGSFIGPRAQKGLGPDVNNTGPGSTSLKPGDLKAAARSRVHQDADDGKGAEIVFDFGNLNHVARFVDDGHANPRATKGLANTPAHPFVRQTEDATADEAHAVYVDTMTALIEKEIQRAS